MNHIPDASFPSDHASVSFAFVTWLWIFGWKKTALWFFPFVLIMNLSRIIAWVHWPFDVIVWAIIWIFSAYMSFSFLTKMKLVKNINSFIMQLLSYIRL
jgi:undecaprenyl-diphosphatase